MEDRTAPTTENQNVMRLAAREWPAWGAGDGTLAVERCQPRSLDTSAMLLAAMWLFIAAVSAIDVYFSIKYEYALLADELNPVGRWLMDLDDGSVGLFMACKFLGNLLALGALQFLYFYHRRLSLLAASVMTAVQGVLATILLAL